MGGVLGTFDPTMLPNGPYTLELTATNAGGHSTTVDQEVDVEGGLKLGNLHLSFTDLTIPVAGIPITITRTYDTLDARTQGDFGYGWKLAEADYKVKVLPTTDAVSGFGDYPAFKAGARVIVTGPSGQAEGFTL